MVFRKKCCENKESHIGKHWQNHTNMWLIYFDYLLSLCFGGFHRMHVALTSRHTVCSFRIIQMERVVWKTVNMIRYGILLTAGGISHLQPNLQNFGLGTVSTLALEVIISLAFFGSWNYLCLYMYHFKITHTQKEYFNLVSDKWEPFEAVSERSQKKVVRQKTHS